MSFSLVVLFMFSVLSPLFFYWYLLLYSSFRISHHLLLVTSGSKTPRKQRWCVHLLYAVFKSDCGALNSCSRALWARPVLNHWRNFELWVTIRYRHPATTLVLFLCTCFILSVSPPVQQCCTRHCFVAFAVAQSDMLFTTPLAIWAGHSTCHRHYYEVPYSRPEHELQRLAMPSYVRVSMCAQQTSQCAVMKFQVLRWFRPSAVKLLLMWPKHSSQQRV